MPRLAHGEVVTPEQLHGAEKEAASGAGTGPAFEAAAPGDLRAFGFLFSDLQNDAANLLPQSTDTLRHLKDLGRAMGEPGTGPGDSGIPSIYTYFGQFVDHDITLEQSSFTTDKLIAANMAPLSAAQIRNLVNLRHPTLDLDSVYGPTSPPGQAPPRDGDKMRIGRVTRLTDPPPVVPVRAQPFLRVRLKDDDNDLPREPPNDQDINHDRAALIGDPRNDENLIVSQLHVAFLKAHNKLVQQGKTFDQARRLLRQHYQHIIIQDFLKRVADPAIVDRIVQHGNSVYHALAEPFFVPLEFTVAAYRFGHSMVRESYAFNLNFNPADLFFLFTFTAFSGQLGGDVAAIPQTNTLPDNWIIEWHRFVDTLDTKASNKARRIDTQLADGLFSLQNVDGTVPDNDEARLAVRNLLRGYGLRIPTGQAVARKLHLPPLTAAQIKSVAASPGQVQALNQGGFLERTPLWYYVLAEAAHPSFGNGQRLGPVGSTIVAEVLIGLTRRSEDSILGTPNWQPSLPAAHSGRFELADLLRFAGVLPRTYKVQAHDTLSTIARDHLGDAGRWPEIFVLNRDDIGHRDQIRVGQVFLLPGDTPAPLRPRLHKVQANETLSGLAKQFLGSAQRFPEISDLNSDVIANPALIHPGQELVILPP
jgi:nucleoid-associated protein YgaU